MRGKIFGSSLSAIVAVGVLLLGSESAQGFWGSHGSHGSGGASAGSWGGGGSNGSWGGHSSWGSGGGSHGSWGSRPGFFARWHANKLARRSYASYGSSGGSSGAYSSWGSSGGSSGGVSYGSNGSSGGTWYGSSGGSTGSYGSHGGSTGSYGSSGETTVGYGSVIEGETVIESAPVESGAPAASEPAAPATDGKETRVSHDGALLTLQVPDHAKVYINGQLTRSTGTNRSYASVGLEPGKRYRYQVRAEWDADGETVSETKVVQLTAGNQELVDFRALASKKVETRLTLNVPETAEVRLAGTKTNMKGSRRTFSTDRLNDGQEWSDYTIEVTVDRNGEALTETKTITLRSGQELELNFDFEENRVASAK